jgi:hypothetical protein
MGNNAALCNRRDNGGTLPNRFTPKFWQDADRRIALVRQIEARVERLKQDAGADSMQKEVLCERTVFLLAVMETNERNALDGEKDFDAGSYTQTLNALVGCLRLLGLEKKAKSLGLSKYVEDKRA